jgi:hypothetical protein
MPAGLISGEIRLIIIPTPGMVPDNINKKEKEKLP